MDTVRKQQIKIFAKDDAKWDKCFVDLNKLGYRTNANWGHIILLPIAMKEISMIKHGIKSGSRGIPNRGIDRDSAPEVEHELIR